MLHKLKTAQRLDYVRNHSRELLGPTWTRLHCGPLFARERYGPTGLAVPGWYRRWSSCRHAGFRKWADRGHFMAALSSSSKGAAGPAGGRDAAHAIEDR